MEKEEPKKDANTIIKERTMEAVQVLQLLVNEYGKKYLDEKEFVIALVQKGGIWSLFLWPQEVDLELVNNNMKLALIQINQLKITKEKMEEEARGRKVQEQYVA